MKKIPQDHLGVPKASTRWVPHNLTTAQKRAPVALSEQILNKFKQGRSNHVYDIATGDKISVYRYESDKKRQ